MPRRKKSDEPIEEIKKIKNPPLVKGMKDILPADEKYWRFLNTIISNLASDFSFTKIDTPILEKYELYAHVFGKNSEMVKKGLIDFLEKNEKVVLRPDFTAGVARAFIEHSLFNQTPPNKYWYSGKVFFQDRLAVSRHREMHQAGFEVYNAPSPAVDAELVMMLYQTFTEMGFFPEVHINSLGCLACRHEYDKALTAFIKSKRAGVCADCRSISAKEPRRFFDCVNQKCLHAMEDAPQTVDYLCDSCHDHLFKFLETLDDLKVEYVLNWRLTRHEKYYNGTIFDIYNKKGNLEKDKKEKEEFKEPLSEKTLLASGGRMNYLCEMLGGPETYAVGIKVYLEKLISAMKEAKLDIPKMRGPHIYLAQLSEQAKREAMAFVEELRREDWRVVANFSKDSLRSQLDNAAKMGAKIVLILGQKEVIDGTILMRDMESSIQEVINRKKVINEIKKKLREQFK